jgi:hypothetical protein
MLQQQHLPAPSCQQQLPAAPVMMQQLPVLAALPAHFDLNAGASVCSWAVLKVMPG